MATAYCVAPLAETWPLTASAVYLRSHRSAIEHPMLGFRIGESADDAERWPMTTARRGRPTT